MSQPVHTNVRNSLALWGPHQPLSGAPFTNPQKGYDVTRAISPSRKALAQKSANVTLAITEKYWPLFVFDVNIDISLGGSTAQSMRTRDFYPRNFVQPHITLQGQGLDVEDYGMLCDFVRYSQTQSLYRSGAAGTATPLTQLNIDYLIPASSANQNGAGSSNLHQSSKGVTLNGAKYPNMGIRGYHLPIVAKGYISAMPREHEHWDYAPKYTLTFTVAEMIKGPWHENLVAANHQSTWVDLIKSQAMTTTTQANINQAKAAYNAAQKAQGSIINGGTSSGGSKKTTKTKTSNAGATHRPNPTTGTPAGGFRP